MKDYISVQDLLKQAIEQGLDLGKGDPYNRLRYYTKMGWIPHMTRKKGEVGPTKGHYPINTIERLILIQKLKDQGLANEEIASKLNLKDKVSSFYSVFSVQQIKNKLFIYATVALLALIVLAELGYIKIGKNKEDIVLFNEPAQTENQIIASGESFIDAGQNSKTIDVTDITDESKVYVTFKSNYGPANRFWVAEQTATKGFTIEVDTAVESSATFSWWISGKSKK